MHKKLIRSIKRLGDLPKKRSKVGTNKLSGRAATGIPKVSRSRLAKLLKITKEELKAIIRELHESGKDATENAILAVLKEREIKASRKAFEDRRDKGGTVADLTALAESGQKFKVIMLIRHGLSRSTAARAGSAAPSDITIR